MISTIYFTPIVISIHDLPRRSTMNTGVLRIIFRISIHDLPRRSTKLQDYSMLSRSAFQSTTSRGGRRIYTNVTTKLIAISIHDLPRRSTLFGHMHLDCAVNFNPRPPEEVDVGTMYSLKEEGNFNPRPPEEVDRRGSTSF